MIDERISNMVEGFEEWIINQRRRIHQNPELSRQEFETSRLIVDELSNMGVKVETGYYNTGVVGIIEGHHDGPTIGLRFDMDALQMQEMTDLPFKSTKDNVMHSCGHDGHTAMGLGVARGLMNMRDEIHGIVKLIFQPAEEDAPNGGGAQHMIEEGALKNPDVDCMLGMHIWPQIETGSISIKKGVMMAASDPFVINIKGKGVHASLPSLGIDPIIIGAQIVNNIQTIVSRNIDSFDQAVISIGVFNGGTRYNVIPDKVVLEGTVRTFDEDVRRKIYKKLKLVVENTAISLGGEATLDYKFSYPALVNDDKIVEIVKDNAKEILGEDHCILLDRPTSGGEDFAYFAKAVPSAFIFLGASNPDSEDYPLHSPYFNFNEKALAVGVKVFMTTAIKLGRTL
ncbi:MAG: amidohydrolase [Maledivibacter sp.]|jgi:amidohydrolase|nr:amidohydrolase [Maledivibacter sp.]